MDLTEIAYCGIYCGLCASRRRIPRQAHELRRAMQSEGYDQWYRYVPDLAADFPQFWSLLQRFADQPCPGCRAGGGPPQCPIRICARARAETVCSHCADFACQHLEMLRRYPMLLADNRRMREIGIEPWAAEQEERAATGFAYTDTRHPTPPAESDEPEAAAE